MEEEEGSYDEEEEYIPISEGVKESKEFTETPGSGRNYITPGISSREISRASSLERTANTNSASIATSRKEGSPHLNPLSEDLDTNSMAGTDIWLPTFNGNGTEDPE